GGQPVAEDGAVAARGRAGADPSARASGRWPRRSSRRAGALSGLGADETGEGAVIRGIAGICIVGMLVAAAVFFADRPGRVDIVWQGWQVKTSVGVLIAAAVLAALLAGVLFSVLSLIFTAPRRMLRARRARRRRAGYRALTRGMVAAAAGDGQEA